MHFHKFVSTCQRLNGPADSGLASCFFISNVVDLVCRNVVDGKKYCPRRVVPTKSYRSAGKMLCKFAEAIRQHNKVRNRLPGGPQMWSFVQIIIYFTTQQNAHPFVERAIRQIE